MRTVETVLIIVLLVVATQCQLRMNPCPATCRCNGMTPGVCTSCYEPYKDIATNCVGCLAGYEYSLVAGRCLQLKIGQCPSLCACEDKDGVCSSCIDPNRNLTVGCAMCSQGFAYNFTSGMCYSLPCPAACKCVLDEQDSSKAKDKAKLKEAVGDDNSSEVRGNHAMKNDSAKSGKADDKTKKKNGKRLLPSNTKSITASQDIVVDDDDTSSKKKNGTKDLKKNKTAEKTYQKLTPGLCIACRDPYKNVSTKCQTCLTGYKLDYFSNKCVSACPKGCVCDAGTNCTDCTDPNMDINFSCKVCKVGYYYDEDEQLCDLYCPSGCVCDDLGACTRCNDPNLNFSLLCYDCNAGYLYNEDTGKCDVHCPAGCKCEGAMPGICSSCKDINRDITLNCSDCMSGYQLQTNPKKPCVPTCQNEDCKCDTPGTCTFCKDSNADPDTQCQECLPGYYYKNADDEKCSKNKTKPSDTKNKTSTPKRNSTDDEDLDAADTTNSTASGTKKDTKKAQKKPKKTSDNDAGDTDEPNNDN